MCVGAGFVMAYGKVARLGRQEESRAEFARAAGMTRNAREQETLLRRAAPERPTRL